jgi:D-threo-aldose 1-dehydrogenase
MTARLHSPLPQLGYGAANLGNLFHALTDDEAIEILDAAWDSGIRYFDTAPHYGLGLSERRFGAFLATKPRDEYLISTKVGRLIRPNPDGAGQLDTAHDFMVPADSQRVWDLTADGIRTSIDESLERTGLDRFDILYLHDPERFDLTQGIDVALPALAALRDEGVTDAIGVGSMDTAALLAAARSGVIDLLMVAGRYTLAEQPALAEVVPACRANGVSIVNASIFNSGLLATDTPTADDRYEYGEVPADVLDRVQRITAVCREFDVSLPTAALHYTLRDDTVTSIVVGGARPHHVVQNVERMAEQVPDELWRALSERNLIPA